MARCPSAPRTAACGRPCAPCRASARRAPARDRRRTLRRRAGPARRSRRAMLMPASSVKSSPMKIGLRPWKGAWRHQALDGMALGRRAQADLDRLARRDQAKPRMIGRHQRAHQLPHLVFALRRQAIMHGDAMRLGLDPHARPALDGGIQRLAPGRPGRRCRSAVLRACRPSSASRRHARRRPRQGRASAGDRSGRAAGRSRSRRRRSSW